MPEERKLVTVLFADIVGSTEMGLSHDPEVVRASLGQAFESASEVLRAHGGTVEKFIGDAVMAVFGVPAAHDDDPDRAVRAAFALRDKLTSADDVDGPALRVRIGVNTDEAVAGSGDTAQFLVTGPGGASPAGCGARRDHRGRSHEAADRRRRHVWRRARDRSEGHRAHRRLARPERRRRCPGTAPRAAWAARTSAPSGRTRSRYVIASVSTRYSRPRARGRYRSSAPSGIVVFLPRTSFTEEHLTLAVHIRLRRTGKTKAPTYRVVVADSRSPRDGKFIEILGHYDPRREDNNLVLDGERVRHWIKNGAKPTATARSLLVRSGIPDAEVPPVAR